MLQPEQLEEIKDIIEMKVTHRRNIIKREARFGHKSNSTIGLDLGGAAANVIAPGLSTNSISPVCIFWRQKNPCLGRVNYSWGALPFYLACGFLCLA